MFELIDVVLGLSTPLPCATFVGCSVVPSLVMSTCFDMIDFVLGDDVVDDSMSRRSTVLLLCATCVVPIECIVVANIALIFVANCSQERKS